MYFMGKRREETDKVVRLIKAFIVYNSGQLLNSGTRWGFLHCKHKHTHTHTHTHAFIQNIQHMYTLCIN